MMNWTVGLEGGRFYAFHGYYEEEQQYGYWYEIDLSVHFEIASIQALEDSVNYEVLYQICKEQMDIPRRLLEEVVADIITESKRRFPQMNGGVISLRKMGVQLGGPLKNTLVQCKF